LWINFLGDWSVADGSPTVKSADTIWLLLRHLPPLPRRRRRRVLPQSDPSRSSGSQSRKQS
jgi:hypothetical protein